MELTCVNKDKHLQTEWTAKWIHQLNRIFIRSPSSEVNSNISTLTIKFCDYKDTGTYICEWTSDEKVYKSSAKVTVHGKGMNIIILYLKMIFLKYADVIGTCIYITFYCVFRLHFLVFIKNAEFSNVCLVSKNAYCKHLQNKYMG